MILYIQPSQDAPMYCRQVTINPVGFTDDEINRLQAGEILIRFGERIVCADALARKAFEENAK